VVTPAVSTVYTVTGSDANNCVNSFTLQILVDPCTGILEAPVEGNQTLLVYPNPGRSVVTIKAERAMELILVNELGQVLRKLELSTENNFEVQVSHLAAGIYFIQSKENSAVLKPKVLVQDY
jgi:Secretion system C-terminal sorting domain